MKTFIWLQVTTVFCLFFFKVNNRRNYFQFLLQWPITGCCDQVPFSRKQQFAMVSITNDYHLQGFISSVFPLSHEVWSWVFFFCLICWSVFWKCVAETYQIFFTCFNFATLHLDLEIKIQRSIRCDWGLKVTKY